MTSSPVARVVLSIIVARWIGISGDSNSMKILFVTNGLSKEVSAGDCRSDFLVHLLEMVRLVSEWECELTLGDSLEHSVCLLADL
jgi:hypothetical protein